MVRENRRSRGKERMGWEERDGKKGTATVRGDM